MEIIREAGQCPRSVCELDNELQRPDNTYGTPSCFIVLHMHMGNWTAEYCSAFGCSVFSIANENSRYISGTAESGTRF